MIGRPVAAAVECPICGGTCTSFLAVHDHHDSYPFLPPGTGVDRMAGEDYVIAPHKIVDPVLERVVYGTGDRVPMADAIRYGLVDHATAAVAGENSPKAPKAKRGQRARKPAEDRAHKPVEDR